MGLLGLVFDPDYATTRKFWINYTETVASQIFTVVAQFTTTVANPDGDLRFALLSDWLDAATATPDQQAQWMGQSTYMAYRDPRVKQAESEQIVAILRALPPQPG